VPSDPISFPDRNPHPVMRVAGDGVLEYANEASEPIRRRLGVNVGERVPDDFRERVAAAGASSPPGSFELECDLRTFEILAIPASTGGFNVYGSDVTAEKVVEKFPDRNPNPVLRMDPEGRLLYANAASQPIVRALSLSVGDMVPAQLRRQVVARLAGTRTDPIELRAEGGRIFALSPVAIPEFGFTNLYGTDITALRAINKFPDENPNPVLRVSRTGRLVYANPASALVREGLGVSVGAELPAALFERINAAVEGRAPDVMEMQHAGRVFEVRIVLLFEFDSINLYGTDVTAARQIEKANAENERLLLNILPASIADRLRHGEEPIADAFDEMAVLFADVVDFTPFSSARSAREVVAVLNQIFSIFDRLVDRHRLEKIKTVGDAYMAVGGLTADGGGVTELVDMALDMIEEMRRYRTDAGVEMQIRVGLHIGPGIGGVIGLKKFIYDVWGDTVNTASRMESHGLPGCVQVTSATAALLADRYLFEPRGPVEVKGKGVVDTCLLVGRRMAPAR